MMNRILIKIMNNNNNKLKMPKLIINTHTVCKKKKINK